MVLPLSTSLLYMLSTELRVSKTDQIPKSEKHRLVAWYMTCYSDIFQVNSAVKLNLFSLVLLVSRCTSVANQITEQPGRWPFALRAVERRGSKNWMGQLRPQIIVVSAIKSSKCIQIPCFYVPFKLDQLAYSCWSKTSKTYLTNMLGSLQSFVHNWQSWSCCPFEAILEGALTGKV